MVLLLEKVTPIIFRVCHNMVELKNKNDDKMKKKGKEKTFQWKLIIKSINSDKKMILCSYIIHSNVLNNLLGSEKI